MQPGLGGAGGCIRCPLAGAGAEPFICPAEQAIVSQKSLVAISQPILDDAAPSK